MRAALSMPRALVVAVLVTAAAATASVAVSTATAPAAGAAEAAPGASNTGVPAGITLHRIDGNVVLDRAGATYTNLDIRGRVRVNAPNITLQNSIVRGNAQTIFGSLVDCNYQKTDHRNFVLRDSTLAPTSPTPYNSAGIMGHDFTVKRVEITGTVDAVDITGSNVTVTRSWLHDTHFYPAAQNPLHRDTHNDGVQVSAGSNIQIASNTITGNRNAALMVAQDQGATSGVRFADNWSNGGACSVNISPTPRTTIGAMTLTHNRFRHDTSVPNCAILQNHGVPLTTSGNVWADTGGAVALTRGQ